MAAKLRKRQGGWEMGEETREPPKTCAVSGKRMYANEREAKATATHRMADTKGGPTQLGTYKCMYCGAWHLTSKRA